MYEPSVEVLSQYRGRYDKAPIALELYMDMHTPIGVLARVREQYDSYFLLESMEGDKKVSSFSFIGYNPSSVVMTEAGENPFAKLRDRVEAIKVAPVPGMPPFYSGGVGYFGYETVQYASPIKLNNKKDLDLPEMLFMFFEEMIVFNHEKQKVYLVALVDLKSESIQESYDEAVGKLILQKELLESDLPKKVNKVKEPIQFRPLETKEAFIEKVDKIKDYIVAGDIFQAVPSTKFYFDQEDDLFAIYRGLRVINPSPYMFIMSYKDLKLAGASPETLVKVDKKRIFTMPIAGTKKRGKTPEEDKQLHDELVNDEKENAEHRMLVDLARNDVGMVSEFGSVEITNYQSIRYFSHVMHMVSEVEGNLKEGYDALSALEAILPAGTLSGAPKIRAMEIIDEVEDRARGVYGGGVGYIGYDGLLDTCIAIRTVVQKGTTGVLQAGAGIVLDSIGESEYEEVCSKLNALIRAIEKVGDIR